MRVLVAHSDADVQAHARAVLEPLGHRIHVYSDAGEALAACVTLQPDVALLDAYMCRRDGVSLLSAIKGHGEAFQTAVILVFEREPALGEAISDLRRGAHDFLVGPGMSSADLVARVEAAGRTKQLQEALLAQGQRLEQLVYEDPLTGLLNRRAILTQLDALVSGARRHGRDLSVLMLDIDNFKAINDTYGHRLGDRVLVGVAQRLRARLRAEDWLGRLGGEEFLALLPDTGRSDAERVGEELRNCVAGAAIDTAEDTVPITVSIGWATRSDEEAEALVHRADDALYVAKSAGRNTVRGSDRPATVRDRS
jgi:two-component system, cell cycle response regulator